MVGTARGADRSFRSTARSTLQGGATYDHSLLKGQGVLVRPELLTALKVAVGDQMHDRAGTPSPFAASSSTNPGGASATSASGRAC